MRWVQDEIELKIDHRLFKNYGRDAHEAATLAAASWNDVPGVPKIRIAQGNPGKLREDEPSNGIYLVEDWPHEPEQLAVTRTTFTEAGQIVGVDILINANMNLRQLNSPMGKLDEEYHDLTSVLAHEMGHVLGLDESLDDESATMWPTTDRGDTEKRDLSEDDINGVTKLYSAPYPEGMGCSHSPTKSLRMRNPWVAVAFAGLGLVLLGRRRRYALSHPSS